MASQESEESVDEDDVCAHRIGVLMAPVKREDVRANVVRSRIGDRSIDLRVVAGHSVLRSTCSPCLSTFGLALCSDEVKPC